MSAVNIRVRVHPVVLFQIADSYERRSIENHRVIGTLVGKMSNIKNRLSATWRHHFAFDWNRKDSL